MSGKHIKSDITAYLTGALPESHRREVDAHVEACEACQSLLAKAKAKLARHRRQALKDADPQTNLFLHRIRRDAGMSQSSDSNWGRWLILFILIAGCGYVGWHKFMRSGFPSFSAMSALESKGSEVQSSTTTAAATDESDVSVAPPPEAKPATPAPTIAPLTPTLPTEAPVASTATAAPVPVVPEAPRNWSGLESPIKDARQSSIKGRTSWRALWSEMGQTDPTPHVDFRTMMVVGVFAGPRPVGSQVVLEDPKDEGDTILVAYRVAATPASAPVDPAAVSHPYAVRTMPRADKAVRFLEETAAATGAPAPPKETQP